MRDTHYGNGVLALMIVLPRVCDIHSNINFDYQTMIVTILGIFITVLIGWQIWQTMISRDEVRQATRTAQQLERIRGELQETRNFADAHFWNTQSRIRLEQGDNYNAFMFSGEAARSYILANTDFNLHTSVSLAQMSASINNTLNGRGNPQDFVVHNGEIEQLLDGIAGAIGSRQEELREAHNALLRIRRLLNVFYQRFPLDTEAPNS